MTNVAPPPLIITSLQAKSCPGQRCRGAHRQRVPPGYGSCCGQGGGGFGHLVCNRQRGSQILHSDLPASASASQLSAYLGECRSTCAQSNPYRCNCPEKGESELTLGAPRACYTWVWKAQVRTLDNLQTPRGAQIVVVTVSIFDNSTPQIAPSPCSAMLQNLRGYKVAHQGCWPAFLPAPG